MEHEDTLPIIDFEDAQKSNDNEKSKDIPMRPVMIKDHYHFISIMFGFLGLVCTLPWNILISANDIWMYKLRNLNETFILGMISHKNDLQKNFLGYLSTFNNIPGLLVVIVMATYGHRVKATIRSITSFLFMWLLFIIIIIIYKINTDQWQTEFFWTMMAISALLALTSNTLNCSIGGIISSFPSSCMESYLIGQSLSGLLPVLFQVIIAILDLNIVTSGIVYFTSTAVLILLTFFGYLFVRRTDYFRYYRKKGQNTIVQLDDIPDRLVSQRSDIMIIIKHVWPHLLTIFNVILFSYSLYPAVCALVIPKTPNLTIFTGRLFYPIACFFVFNISDLFGRLIGKYAELPQNKPMIMVSLSFLRVINMILILFCNIKVKRHIPIFFISEVYYIIFMALLGFFNGYLLCQAFVQGPKLAPKNVIEKTGIISVASLIISSFFGSAISTVIITIF